MGGTCDRRARYAAQSKCGRIPASPILVAETRKTNEYSGVSVETGPCPTHGLSQSTWFEIWNGGAALGIVSGRSAIRRLLRMWPGYRQRCRLDRERYVRLDPANP